MPRRELPGLPPTAPVCRVSCAPPWFGKPMLARRCYLRRTRMTTRDYMMQRISKGRTGRTLPSAALLVAALACGASGAWAAGDAPLAIARDGFFYVGGKSGAINGRPYMSGQIYGEFRIPAPQTHPLPL